MFQFVVLTFVFLVIHEFISAATVASTDITNPFVDLPCKKQTCRYGNCENVVVNGHLDFICHCVKGVAGKRCDELDREKLPCSPNPCYANAKCYNYQSSYFCECPVGRTGRDCSISLRSVVVDSCLANPCGNKGLCFSASNGYWCFCDDGTQGLKCVVTSTELMNICTPNSCLNNGKCYTVKSSIVCACPPGFYGAKCEFKRINSVFTPECNSQLCYNNGVCTLSNNTISCSCNALYAGKFCEIPIFSQCGFGLCHSSNGKCLNGQCICFQGYFGDKCHLKVQKD